MMRALLGMVGILIAGCSGCGPQSSEGAGGAAASVAASSSSSSGAVIGSSGSGPSECLPGPIPDGVPEGWIEYADWSCECRFYVPTAPDVVPPFQWKACSEQPEGIECLQIDHEWYGQDHSASVDPYQEVFSRDDEGTPLLLLHRTVHGHHSVYLVVEASGAVRSAVYLPWYAADWNALGCQLHIESVSAGHWILEVEGDVAASQVISDHFGAIGGPVDSVPAVLVHDQQSVNSGWSCSESLVWRIPTSTFEARAYPWDMSSSTLVHSPAIDPENLHLNQPVAMGEALFFKTNTLKRSGINVWTPGSGFRLFRRWPDDFTRGAADLGTDGVDLVWGEGEGKEPNEVVYPVRHIMTAPFTTDPAALRPRRVRSFPNPIIGLKTMKVGCGYAAHLDGQGGILVVRLSDGWSWSIPNTDTQELTDPLGVTCDEVFALGYLAGTPTKEIFIARVRIDSLGPGVPPD